MRKTSGDPQILFLWGPEWSRSQFCKLCILVCVALCCKKTNQPALRLNTREKSWIFYLAGLSFKEKTPGVCGTVMDAKRRGPNCLTTTFFAEEKCLDLNCGSMAAFLHKRSSATATLWCANKAEKDLAAGKTCMHIRGDYTNCHSLWRACAGTVLWSFRARWLVGWPSLSFACAARWLTSSSGVSERSG